MGDVVIPFISGINSTNYFYDEENEIEYVVIPFISGINSTEWLGVIEFFQNFRRNSLH